MKSERTEMALSLIKNLDQALQKINHDIAVAALQGDEARRNARFAREIHHLYSSTSTDDSHVSPFSVSASASPTKAVAPKDSDYLQLIEMERMNHAQTKLQLESSRQKELQLEQIIKSLEDKLALLQKRIIAAEEDAQVALDLAKSNDACCRQLELSLEQCRLDKYRLQQELHHQQQLHSTQKDKHFVETSLSPASPSHTSSQTMIVRANRAMVAMGREIYLKSRQGSNTVGA